MTAVKAWIENIVIPTYQTGEPEKNPMFLEKRVYQGSSGVVYPHPVIEKIADEKKDQTYTALWLENEYLLIMILPELGGRIQRAYDKIRKRDFVYYNQVIKPALVGLAGPWISGGIEFNWPQHHRPSTFSPIDYSIESNEDGSKTVWVNETEIMFRTKGMAGFTLYPGKAYLEIKGKLFNRTPFPQTFLWWANPAVKVNEHYQSIFPPDVYAVFDHGKRDVSDFPIATGTYYKVNYAPGTDISRYHTIPVPTSYMAIQSQYNFMGCYEHDNHAGMLHVANHHFSPGKKQWTWGNGEFGYAWDRNLTDEDGPYIELMTGVFTDNQPDFSWLSPNESKTFEQYFMPYAAIGAVKNASKEAMINMDWKGNSLVLKAYATMHYPDASINIYHKSILFKTYTFTLSPIHIFSEEIHVAEPGAAEDWRVVICNQEGLELIAYQPEKHDHKHLPEAAIAAPVPGDIEQIEDLYLNGLHLEQYRHATYNPADYYQEGLRRSPGDIRCNNAMGLLLLRRGQFEQSIPYFRKAIQTLTKRNPNPYDGEPYYNLGWALKMSGRPKEAYDAFYKATWNDAWQHSGFLNLARMLSSERNWKDAMTLIEKSLVRNTQNPVVRHLKAALLRKNNLLPETIVFCKDSLSSDPFNYGCLFEQYLAFREIGDQSSAEKTLSAQQSLMRADKNNYLELSLDYAHTGLYEEAIHLLQLFQAQASPDPLTYYYIGWLFNQKGEREQATTFYKTAADQDPSYCFPNKIEEILILQDASKTNPVDAYAPYYLGNLWYDKKQYSLAIECWEKSVSLGPNFPTVHRNLALAYYNKCGLTARAVESMEKAFELDQSDARILMELDQLYKITGRPFRERHELFQQYPDLVLQRDDLYLEQITLLNNLEEYEQALQLILARKFHPWEGGEGKVVGQYILSTLAITRKYILKSDYDAADTLIKSAFIYPENLGEGKLYGSMDNDIYFLSGYVYEKMGQHEAALEAFEKARNGISEPVEAIYYNDPQPDKIFYQALAWIKTGQVLKGKEILKNLINFSERQALKVISIDYFAVSLPDMLVFDVDINHRNQVFCKYLRGLGELGLANYETASQLFEAVLKMDINHQGAAIHLKMIPFFKTINQDSLAK